MSTYSPAHQRFHEIVSVGAPLPRIECWLSDDSNAGPVEYLSAGELVPEMARKVVIRLAATIHQRFNASARLSAVKIRQPTRLSPRRTQPLLAR